MELMEAIVELNELITVEESNSDIRSLHRYQRDQIYEEWKSYAGWDVVSVQDWESFNRVGVGP